MSYITCKIDNKNKGELNNIFIQATEFYDASQKLCNNCKYLSRKSVDTTLIIPALICVAFSCELYLKAILYPQRIKEHNLNALFHNLPEIEKIEIKNRISHDIYEYFDDELLKISSAFVDWRYFYQNDELELNHLFLVDFMKALNDYCIIKYSDDNVNPYSRTVIISDKISYNFSE